MYDKPAEQEEDDDSSVEYPLVLLGSALHHTYSVATDTQCICCTIQPSLRAFEHLSLLAEVAQNSTSSI
jgi:hypothetical protein